MIEEINGRWTCTDCGYEWSACISDDAVPEVCECQKVDYNCQECDEGDDCSRCDGYDDGK
jgi:hypothetical protein